jgi:hypothetical protein
MLPELAAGRYFSQYSMATFFVAAKLSCLVSLTLPSLHASAASSGAATLTERPIIAINATALSHLII